MRTLTTSSYSLQDLSLAIADKIGFLVTVKSWQFMKNGCLLVCYRVLSSGRNCATFLSVTVALRAKMKRIVERSKKVTFTPQRLTSSGYRVGLRGCSCPAYRDVKTAMKVSGTTVCKHTIAYAKKYLGCQSLSDFILKVS